MNIGQALTASVSGLTANTITVQAFITPGLPTFTMVGTKDTVLLQARERVRAACKTTGLSWPKTRITVNLSPASLPKYGASYDLAIAACLCSAMRCVNPFALDDTLVLGELALDGSVLPVTSVLPIVSHALATGIQRIILPEANVPEARILSDDSLSVLGVKHIQDLLRILGASSNTIGLPVSSSPSVTTQPAQNETEQRYSSLTDSSYQFLDAASRDFTDVIGHEDAKWALEIAAAGGHHVLMQGPPGVGKTMLASRLPSILPDLTHEEAIEAACIRSSLGLPVTSPLDVTAPFLNVHHNVTLASFTGGIQGATIKPGAMTLAHHGILFLDEAPEFERNVMQALRTPLETGFVTVTRLRGAVSYPAQFQLILAQNPCPCGQLWSTHGECTCTAQELRRYRQRISGPIRDRIDIKLDVPPVHSLATPAASSDMYSPLLGTHAHWDSDHMRETVRLARERSAYRYQNLPWSTNAHADASWLMRQTPQSLLTAVNALLKREEITVRGAHKILRIAWSISDLLGKGHPDADDLSAAQALYLPGN